MVTWRGCLGEGVLQGHHGLAGAPGHHHAVTGRGVYRVKRLEQPLRSVAPLVHQEVPHKVVLIHIIHIAENNNNNNSFLILNNYCSLKCHYYNYSFLLFYYSFHKQVVSTII